MTDATARRAARKTMTPDPDPRPPVVDIAIPCAAWRRAAPELESLARAAAAAALAGSGKKPVNAELSLVFADDAEITLLNERWRNRAGPTNVLAFASEDDPVAGAPLILGDVVLAYETVAREARDQGKSLADHVRHLVIHGVLHLLGYDHQQAAPARRMEALETRILASLGVADPYRMREDADG